jgi:hypothetical protein
MSWPSQTATIGRQLRLNGVLGVALLLGPSALLAFAALNSEGAAKSVSIGVGVTLAVEALFLLVRFGAQRATSSLFTVAFYSVSALVLRFNSPDLNDPATNAALGISILIPVVLFLIREVRATGGNAREAKFLINRLLARKEWPASFAEYRTCPLIAALRDGIRENAAPVLPLLAHDDVRVQMATLTVLEFYPNWRKDQVEPVLQLAGMTNNPTVRAAALLAAAYLPKSRHLKFLLPYLSDQAEEVRRAAATAVLVEAGPRWPEVRAEVRQALAAPHAAKDGPLPCSANFSSEIIADLVNWSVESGPVGKRSTQTLVRHCKKLIHEDGTPQAIERVTGLIASPKVPGPIRVELAHRLQTADMFPVEIAVRLLSPSSPTMLRVQAAGALLSHGDNPEAVDVLREAAQQPNREITLAAAALVQKYLSVDLGLSVGGSLPAVNSREAAEVARRVAKWASDPGSQIGVDTPSDALDPAEGVAYF